MICWKIVCKFKVGSEVKYADFEKQTNSILDR